MNFEKQTSASCYFSCTAIGMLRRHTEYHVMDFYFLIMSNYLTFGYYWTKITDITHEDLCTLLITSRQNTQENIKAKIAVEVSHTIRENNVALRWRMYRILTVMI